MCYSLAIQAAGWKRGFFEVGNLIPCSNEAANTNVYRSDGDWDDWFEGQNIVTKLWPNDLLEDSFIKRKEESTGLYFCVTMMDDTGKCWREYINYNEYRRLMSNEASSVAGFEKGAAR